MSDSRFDDFSSLQSRFIATVFRGDFQEIDDAIGGLTRCPVASRYRKPILSNAVFSVFHAERPDFEVHRILEFLAPKAGMRVDRIGQAIRLRKA